MVVPSLFVASFIASAVVVAGPISAPSGDGDIISTCYTRDRTAEELRLLRRQLTFGGTANGSPLDDLTGNGITQDASQSGQQSPGQVPGQQSPGQVPGQQSPGQVPGQGLGQGSGGSSGNGKNGASPQSQNDSGNDLGDGTEAQNPGQTLPPLKVAFHSCCTTPNDCTSTEDSKHQVDVLNENYQPCGISWTLANATAVTNENCDRTNLESENEVDNFKISTREGGADTMNVVVLPTNGGRGVKGKCYSPPAPGQGQGSIEQTVGNVDGCAIAMDLVKNNASEMETNNPPNGQSNTILSHEAGHFLSLEHVPEGNEVRPGVQNIMVPFARFGNKYAFNQEQCQQMRAVVQKRLSDKKEIPKQGNPDQIAQGFGGGGGGGSASSNGGRQPKPTGPSGPGGGSQPAPSGPSGPGAGGAGGGQSAPAGPNGAGGGVVGGGGGLDPFTTGGGGGGGFPSTSYSGGGSEVSNDIDSFNPFGSGNPF
ncbi:hypothetical protein CDD83_6152 [Cordyceps sp. RAO-2017]|nr:hypothetical protein CDD83_6152 [Cordyceps sp. RAO-2017]